MTGKWPKGFGRREWQPTKSAQTEECLTTQYIMLNPIECLYSLLWLVSHTKWADSDKEEWKQKIVGQKPFLCEAKKKKNDVNPTPHSPLLIHIKY